MPRNTHSKRQVEDALRYAESNGWRVESQRSHWGVMYCPANNRLCACGEFCMTSIAGAPQNPETHARKLRRIVDRCLAAQAARHERGAF
ncbi:hypothetical protein SAMN04515659_0713 [Dyella sp. 333MFSha]|nr:hypothetical protein SAMN04515659_0713 [Dyella sp. 333MFSha]